MSDNEWRRMYEGNWDAVDKGGSSLTIDDLEKAAEKAHALPALMLFAAGGIVVLIAGVDWVEEG